MDPALSLLKNWEWRPEITSPWTLQCLTQMRGRVHGSRRRDATWFLMFLSLDPCRDSTQAWDLGLDRLLALLGRNQFVCNQSCGTNSAPESWKQVCAQKYHCMVFAYHKKDPLWVSTAQTSKTLIHTHTNVKIIPTSLIPKMLGIMA